MTPVQARLLTFIISYSDAEGASPSFTEMMAALGITSRGGMHEHMRQLVRDGWIEYSGVRNISILKRPLWLSPYGLPALEKLSDGELADLGVRITIIQAARRQAA